MCWVNRMGDEFCGIGGGGIDKRWTYYKWVMR